MVAGDFESSEFGDGHDDLMGVLTGRQAPAGQVLNPLPSPVNPR